MLYLLKLHFKIGCIYILKTADLNPILCINLWRSLNLMCKDRDFDFPAFNQKPSQMFKAIKSLMASMATINDQLWRNNYCIGTAAIFETAKPEFAFFSSCL